MRFYPIVSRILVGVIVGLVLAFVRKASAVPFTVSAPGTTYSNSGSAIANKLYVRFANPSGPSMTITVVNFTDLYIPVTSGLNPSVRLSWPNSTFTVAAGATVDVPLGITVLKNEFTTGTKTGPESVVAGGLYKIGSGAFVAMSGSLGVTVNASSGGSWGVTEANQLFQLVQLSVAPPLAKITVNADANAVGARFWRTMTSSGVQSIHNGLTLALGSNVVLNTTTPDSWTAGTYYQIVQQIGTTFTVIGETAIIKDASGNFDLTFAAVGIPVSGVVTVTGQLGLTGLGQIVTAGGLTPYAFTFDGTATTRATQTWTPATQIAQGAAVTVQYRETVDKEWQTVGTGTIEKAPDGSFTESVTASGAGDPEAPPIDSATFILDLVSFDPSAKVIQLEINGQTFTPSGSGVGGDAINGARSTLQISLPGDPSQYAGKPYRWKVSGTMGGLAVNGKTLTDGTAPQLYFSDFESGFIASNQAIIGNPVNDPGEVPDNPFNPQTLPADAAAQAMQDNYRATRKAMEDALNPGKPQAAPNTPGSGEGDAVAKALNAAGAGFGTAVSGAGAAVAGPGSGTFSSVSSTYNLNLPVFGTAQLNLAGLDPWPGLIRALLLAWLCWMSSIAGMRIFRGAFAG